MRKYKKILTVPGGRALSCPGSAVALAEVTVAEIRFVLVAMPRTGSTVLVDLLNSHGDIFCDNELYNPYQICRYRYDDTDIEGVKCRNANPLRFWDEFFYSQFAKKQKVIGFNFMLGHNYQILDNILKDKRLNIIYLTRENKLAQYSSYKIAYDTQSWGITDEPELAQKVKQTVTFDLCLFDHWLQETMTYEYMFESILDTRRRDAILIEYKQLFQKDIHKKMCRYLGVKFKPLTCELFKQNENRIIDRFENQTDVRAYLDLIGKKYWESTEL